MKAKPQFLHHQKGMPEQRGRIDVFYFSTKERNERFEKGQA
jgi:hypothetical protein